MRSENRSPAQHKLRALDRLARAQLDEAAQSLLVHVVGTYLVLDAVGEAEFDKLYADPAAREAREMVNYYEQRAEKRGEQRGEQRGMEKGLTLGQQRTLLNLLRHRFGDLPTDVVEDVKRIHDPARLDDLVARALEAGSLADMGLAA